MKKIDGHTLIAGMMGIGLLSFAIGDRLVNWLSIDSPILKYAIYIIFSIPATFFAALLIIDIFKKLDKFAD